MHLRIFKLFIIKKVDQSEIEESIRRKPFEAASRYLKGDFPFIESHRGCTKEEPENTLAAFTRAIQIGCDSIELDVWLTSDKIPVVIHGTKKGEIHETTNGTGIITEMTFREISNFFTSNNQPIPTLEDVFKLCKGKIFINIEIKDPDPNSIYPILELINKHDMSTQIAISSFFHFFWEELRKKQSETTIEFGFLFDSDEKEYEVNHHIERENHTLNVWYKDINQDLVKKAHDYKLAVQCWFCMTDPESEDIFRFLFECGVDIVCTNSPLMALKVREEMFGIGAK